MKKIFFFLILNCVYCIVNCALAQNTWTQKASFSGAARRSAIGFAIGNNGYMGTGYNGNFYDDLWQYDPTNDVWTQMASFAGTARFSAVAFVLGTNAYIGTGYDVNNNFNTSDFWKYDSQLNSWSQIANMPSGQERRYACAFTAKGKGYVGTGVGTAGYLNDLWEYTAGTNTWTQRANLPGAPRYECVAFNIGDYGYIGCGAYAGTIYSDFYEYQPQGDVWVQRANYPGAGGDAAAGFALEVTGYIGTGSTQGTYPVDFYEWNQYDDTWSAKANFPAAGRAFGTGFSILGKGYMGMGEATGYFNDWWEYTPDSIFSSVKNNTEGEEKPTVFVNHHTLFIRYADEIKEFVEIVLYDMSGKRVMLVQSEFSNPKSEMSANVGALVPGLYVYSIEGKKNFSSGKIIVTE